MPLGIAVAAGGVDVIEVIFWGALVLALGFAIFHIRRHAGQVGSLAVRQTEEEAEFAEREVQAALAQAGEARESIAGVSGGAESPLPAGPPQGAAPTGRAEPALRGMPAVPAAPVAPEPASDPMEALVRKLRGLRVITDKQGDLPLSVPPNGALYSLRRGGTAAVLPRFESEAVLAHFARRYDLVFCPAQDGSVVVLERLEQRLVDLVDDPGG